MNFPRLEIHTTPALIGIETRKGYQTIEQPKADLTIEQPKAEMTIRQKPAKLLIDQTQAWRDMEIYGPIEASKRRAQEGYQKLLEGIARRAQEGNQLMKIENGTNAIKQIAKAKNTPQIAPINIKWIPSVFSVKIEFEPNELDIQVEPRKPIINARANRPIINYQPGDVSIYMRQYNDIQIDVKV